MGNMMKNNKGIVLIASYFVLIVILGLTGVTFFRAINESRFSQRNSNSVQALYAAEAGLAYAYAEAVSQNFQWYTHEDNNTPVNANKVSVDNAGTAATFVFPVPLDTNINNIKGSFIDPITGQYQVGGPGNFQVRSFPEQDVNGNYTGVLVVVSEGTVNNISRTIEWRLDQANAYEFFFFFPRDHIFDTATFDGRNFGAIHVNGDILFTGDPEFHFLTQLSSGSDALDKGFIRRPLKAYSTWGQSTQLEGFYDGRWDGGPGIIDYFTSPSTVTTMRWFTNNNNITWHMWDNINQHFQIGDTKFITGPVDTPNPAITLHYYLDGTAAYWEFDKYAGDFGDINDKLPFEYRIRNEDKHNLSLYELSGHKGSVSLLDNNKIISMNVPSQGNVSMGEEEIFKLIYDQFPNQDPDNFPFWTEFWTKWKNNHINDHSGLTRNDERRFYRAAYDWTNPYTPTGVNMEWWEDLEHGTDRPMLSNDMAPAQVVDNNIGQPLDQYFLNTRQQVSTWTGWLQNNSLDIAATDKTQVQDRSQGGKYLATPKIIASATDYSSIRKRAQDSGIYIGPTDAGFVNPLNGCGANSVKQFFNAQHPTRAGNKYKPSNILEIDLADFHGCIGPNFNGIVYIDLEGFDWPGPYYDNNSDGVMLVNGERLPDGGLSIISPNNIYIKGNYNLDPTGFAKTNRDPDDDPSDNTDGNVIDGVIASKAYLTDWADLQWQPAEIITSRAVYTLSEDFAEPQTMPLTNNYEYQGRDENSGYTDADVIDHIFWGTPGAGWMPSTSSSDSSNRINDWFTYTGVNRPVEWTTNWIETNWGPWLWADPKVFSFDTNGDGTKDKFILRRDLKSDLYSKINEKYNQAYKYNSSNPVTAYQKANKVSKKHIYNTAIVTPFSTDTYALEEWDNSTDRVINGAFIQLPLDDVNNLPIPAESYESWRRVSQPKMRFNYETRYGRGANAGLIPPVGLMFGADASWREM